MENISYGKIVLIGAGHVGSAILDSLLRMNLADEIVVINRNQKKALGVVLVLLRPLRFSLRWLFCWAG